MPPSFAHVEGDFRCPKCRSVVTDLLWVRWGHLVDYQPAPELTYRIGDAIRWRLNADGSVSGWTYFGPVEMNLGEPACTDLILRDEWLSGSRCRSCGEPVGGGAVEVRGGVITRAWVYPPSELDNDAWWYLIGSDAELVPMWDWNEHLMTYVDPA